MNLMIQELIKIDLQENQKNLAQKKILSTQSSIW
jgi:hypothetical protein